MDQTSDKMDESKSPEVSFNDAQTTVGRSTSSNASRETRLPASQITTEPLTALANQDAASPSAVPIQRDVSDDDIITPYSDDPYALRGAVKEDITKRTLGRDHPRGRVRKINKYYNRQNALIDAYLGSSDEEALEIEDNLANGGKVKFAVYGSSTVNFFLFIIQLYAAVSTGSLSLFGTAADAFVSPLYSNAK